MNRKVGIRLVAVLAVATTIALAVLLLPGRGSNHGVADRALAAIGTGEVMHMATEMPAGMVFVDLQTGHRTAALMTWDVWYDAKKARAHIVLRFQHRVADLLLPEDLRKPGVSVGSIDPGFLALGTGYQRALRNGSATLERSGRAFGHDVYWLRFASVRPHAPGSEVAIDVKTYRPVLFRTWITKTRHIDERVLVAETKAFDAADFRRRGVGLFGSDTSSSSSSGSSSALAQPPPTLRAPWLTPGRTAAGLRLTSAGDATTSTNGRTIHGIELSFGGGRGPGPGTVTIDEYRQPDDPALWKTIPRGTIRIEESENSSASGGTYNTWSGSGVKEGIYFTIETGKGQRAVVAIARALHRATAP
jgi:hypothetical protein